MNLDGPPLQAEILDTGTGKVAPDPRGRFVKGADSTIKSVVTPVLTGQWTAYFDGPANRWLPVYDARSVSPDGSRYAYAKFSSGSMAATIHVVDVATGRDRQLNLKGAPWSILAFEKEGIYLHEAYEGFGPGLTLVNPDTGAVRTVLSEGTVEAVGDGKAWIATRNLADKLPEPGGIGPALNTVSRRDLVTGATVTWLYRPGSDLFVSAAVDDVLFVSARTFSGASNLVVSSPNQPRAMVLPFTLDDNPLLQGFVADSQGIWIGSLDGVYLWTARTGGVLVSDVAATPAGTCA
jgi:hypothetical protein